MRPRWTRDNALRLGGAFAMLALGCAAEPETEARVLASIEAAPPAATNGTRIDALGAFSCDFVLDFTQLTQPPGPLIERDRVLMQRFAHEMTYPNDPGMIQKHIPMLPIGETSAFSGGRYLFQGRWQAAEYERFVTETFTYPGTTQFLDRPEFADPECRDWTVLSAWRFRPLADHTALRTERFDTGQTTVGGEVRLALRLLGRARGLMADADARGLAEVHLLHNLRDHKVQIVYFASRVLPPDPAQPDGAAFGALAGGPALGDALGDDLGLTRVFDRTHFVLTTWLPYETGDAGEAALWPNSPPFPEPFCGDAVCVPSRGESDASCPVACAPGCGDAVCQPGETLDVCPSDCELPLAP